MTNDIYIGIDLGGSNVRAGLISEKKLVDLFSEQIDPKGTVDEVLDQIFYVIEKLDVRNTQGIGIGVPSVVDVERGIVYDVQNIPSWTEVSIGDILKKRYQVPVSVNNDANCFALAEYYFGKGQGYNSMIGLIMGTGIAGGIIINGKLYAGSNCGAGEFGMIGYLDKHFEYFSSGQFFSNVYNLDGAEVALQAANGDNFCIEIMEEFGTHLGNTISAILYAYDPQSIILGGSVSKSYHLYKKSMWKVLEKFTYSPTIKNLKLEVSVLEHAGVLGAAALNINIV